MESQDPGTTTEQQLAAEEEATSAASAAAEADGGAAAEEAAAEPVEHDLAELRAKAEQADEYLALAQRTQADFENYRRRMSRDLAAAEVRGLHKLAKELLPAIDNLDRAITATEDEGFRLVHAELTAALARVGIEGYAPKGEPFDPTWHEAMAQQPVEGAETGTIVEVYQPGYRLNDTVLRPARVVVAA
jgi:molecular chaperone GrpE